MKHICILIFFTFLSLNTSAMDLFIETPNDGTLTLEVEANDTVENVKSKIQENIGIIPANQTLRFNGSVIVDGRTLSDYNITANSTIQLTDATLGVLDLKFNGKQLNIYPNPSSDFIQITGLTKTEHYVIYNVIGTEAINKTVFNNEKIEIKNLSNGLYFLKFDDGNTLKFLKN